METNPSGPRALGARAKSNRRTGRIVAALLIAATLWMWWSVAGSDPRNCTTYGVSPQNASLATVGQTPIGCTG
jgi:hypothetical protein